jgi:hypothetical protein
MFSERLSHPMQARRPSSRQQPLLLQLINWSVDMRAGVSQRLDKGLETVPNGVQVKRHSPGWIDEDYVFAVADVQALDLNRNRRNKSWAVIMRAVAFEPYRSCELANEPPESLLDAGLNKLRLWEWPT